MRTPLKTKSTRKRESERHARLKDRIKWAVETECSELKLDRSIAPKIFARIESVLRRGRLPPKPEDVSPADWDTIADAYDLVNNRGMKPRTAIRRMVEKHVQWGLWAFENKGDRRDATAHLNRIWNIFKQLRWDIIERRK
jgi:hypothetical protein